MPNTIEVSKSGRAKCRGCKEAIAKDTLRFGEEVENQFDAGAPTLVWYHLLCAAQKRPQKLKATLAEFSGEISNRAELDAAIANAKPDKASKAADRVYPYAEIAPTGRSKCLQCDQAIAKDDLRVAVEREVEIAGVMRPSPGYLHIGCAAEYVESDDLAEHIRANSSLEPAQLESALKVLAS